MKIFVKNLLTNHNLTTVKFALDSLDVLYGPITCVGEFTIPVNIDEDKYLQIKAALLEKGFPLITDHKSILVERIKHVVIEMLDEKAPPIVNYSTFIKNKIFLNYTYLANIFSETQGITIEHFIINQKIEKVKENLLYSNLSIGQIANKLHYSSIGHLSNQFKKVVGCSPLEFKKRFGEII